MHFFSMTNLIKQNFLLDPDIIFLNHGSFGACPQPVFEAYQAWQRKLEHQPVQFFGRDYVNYDKQARQVLGDEFNVDPDDLVYIPNATYGVNVIAHSLSDQPASPLCPDDEILSTDHEYGACNHAWEYVCRKTGAKYVCQPIPLPVTLREIVDQFWREYPAHAPDLPKPHHLAHCPAPACQAICQRAHQAGILTAIDGAHAPGQIPLDLQAIGADFYTGNCHKWMMAPKGAAFLYARPGVQPLIEPLVVGWGWNGSFKVSGFNIFQLRSLDRHQGSRRSAHRSRCHPIRPRA
jgi:isopenicillin-N epimerase